MSVKILKSSWAASVDGSVHCTALSQDGLQIAIGSDTATFILDTKTGAQIARIENPSSFQSSQEQQSIAESSSPHQSLRVPQFRPLQEGQNSNLQQTQPQGPVTALIFGKKGRIIVGAQGTVRLWRIESHGLVEDLDISANNGNGSVKLCLQPGGELIGAVCETGRHIYILDMDLQVRSQLVLLPKFGNISELLWLSKTAILATSTDGLHIWREKHSEQKPALTLGQSIGLVTASASPETSTLASASRDGVVYIWTVEEDENAKEHDEILSAELRSTLKEYPCQVHPMSWDKHGKYLATADGPEATVWEIPRLLRDMTQNIVCTGHDAASRIVQAAFQEDGPMLATAANDGSVLIFNSDRFQPGKHSKPTARIQSDFGSDPVSSLLWTPGGKFVVGLSSGRVGLFSLGQPVPSQASSKSIVPSELSSVEAASPRPLSSVFKSPNEELATSLTQHPGAVSYNKTRRPVPSDLPKTNSGLNGLGRQRSSTKGAGLLPKLSNQSMISDRSSSFKSREGADGRREDRSWSSSLHNQQSLLSGDSISVRSTSLQDSQPGGTRNGSLERGGGLSPGLWQSIQNVGKKRSQSQVLAPREPAGWGQGMSNSMPGPQISMQMPVPVPYSPGSHNPQVGPGYMMVANPQLGPQYMPTQAAFPQQMAHVPMLTHPHLTPPGMVDGSGMQHFPPQVMYMQVPHNMAAQPQWGGMMQAPWVGPYMVHPSQQSMQKSPSVVPSIARASSVPEDQMAATWLQSPYRSQEETPVSVGPKTNQQDLGNSNSISLPESTTADWRQKMKEVSVKPSGKPGQSKEKGEQHDVDIGNSFQNMNIRDDPEGMAQGPGGGTNDTIYVGNLAQAVSETHLSNTFSKYGTITHTQVIRDKMTNVSRGFGFVSFLDPNAASKAIVEMNGQKVFGMFNSRSLKVSSSNRPAQAR